MGVCCTEGYYKREHANVRLALTALLSVQVLGKNENVLRHLNGQT